MIYVYKLHAFTRFGAKKFQKFFAAFSQATFKTLRILARGLSIHDVGVGADTILLLDQTFMRDLGLITKSMFLRDDVVVAQANGVHIILAVNFGYLSGTHDLRGSLRRFDGSIDH